MAPSTKKKTTSSAKKNTKKPAPKRQTAAQLQAQQRASRQLWAIIVFALGVLFASITLIEGQNVWLAVHNLILGLFGWSAFMISPIFFYIAIMATLDKPLGSVKHKIWQTFLLAGFVSGAIQIFGSGAPAGEGVIEYARELYEAGIALDGGGLVSAVFGLPLLNWFGSTGAKISICLLIFVSIMILTGATLIGLYQGMTKPVQKIERSYTERRIQRQEQLEAMDEAEVIPPPPVQPVNVKRSRFNIDQPVDEPIKQEAVPAAVEPQPEPVKPVSKTLTQRAQQAKDKLLGITPAEPAQVEEIPAENDSMDIPTPQEELPESPSLDKIIGKITELPPVQPVDPSQLMVGDEPFADSPEPITENISDTDDVVEIDQEPFERLETALTDDAVPPPPVYEFPPLELLDKPVIQDNSNISDELKTNAAKLVDTLQSFGVQSKIIDIARGPAVTRYELQPAPGVKVSKITGLADDIALNLAASGVRIEAPIPNKAAVGIEIPNHSVTPVKIREILETEAFTTHPSKVSVALGKDITGVPTVADLAKMPHTLIAGSTGSGKSVCINSIIVSILYKADPNEVKLLMVDPKMVELGIYNGIPHLLVPVVTDPKKAAGALNWAVTEMLGRYQLFKENSVRDFKGYNRAAEQNDALKPMPQIVIIIDELADLMIAAPSEVEDAICRLAQMARAAGMHLVIATQRPSVDVITGVIKANIPSRIAFAVSSQIDSRTILDSAGAEKLLGKGDMLFSPMGSSKPTRVQGCFVADDEVERIVEFIKKQSGSAEYDQQVIDDIERHAVTEKKKSSASADGGGFDDEDEMLPSAIECVIDAGQASTSLLQRKLKLGYARAARLVDTMEEKGIVGPYEGSKPRAVLISRERWIEMKLGSAQRAKEEWGD